MPSPREKKDPRLFARNVRAAVADCLGIPCTDHSYDDVKLQMAAIKQARSRGAKDQIAGAAGVEMRALRGVVDVDVAAAKQYVMNSAMCD